MDTSCNHLREPGYQESSFIRARGYLHDLSKPEKEVLLSNLVSGTGNILVENFPDEEDLTQVMQGSLNVLKFKNKIFNPEKCSGMGKVFLRKNLVKSIHDCGKPMNILTLKMFEDERGLPLVNTMFIIQYDYDLDKGFITIPENSVLVFAGGSLSNGTVILNNTLILPAALDIEHFMPVNIRGTYREGSLVYLRKHLRLFDGHNWINVCGHADLGPRDKFEIVELLKAYLNKCLDIVAPFKIELIPEKSYVEKGVHDIKVSWNYNRLISNQEILLTSDPNVEIHEELDKNIRSYTFENIELSEPVSIVIATTYKGNAETKSVTLGFNKNPGLVIDDELDENSTNPVTNRAITEAIRAIEERLNSFVTEEELQNTLENYPKKSELQNTLGDYLKKSEAESTYQHIGNYANASHRHVISDIEGLEAELSRAGAEYTLDKDGNNIILKENGVVKSTVNIPGIDENALRLLIESKLRLSHGDGTISLKYGTTDLGTVNDEKGSTTSGLTLQDLKDNLTLTHPNNYIQLNYGNTRLGSAVIDETGDGGGGESDDGLAGNILIYFLKTDPIENLPATPAPNQITDTGDWETNAPNHEVGKYIWMSQIYEIGSKSKKYGNWSVPVLIDNGSDSSSAGSDVSNIEFIYALSDIEDFSHSGLRNPADYEASQTPDYMPDQLRGQWFDNPQGISPNTRFEFMSYRTKNDGTWSRFVTPMLWCAYGRDGIDGDGVEYIFYKGEFPPADTDIQNPSKWYTDELSKNGETDSDGKKYNSSEYILRNSDWVDDPENLLPGESVWVSIRKYRNDSDTEAAEAIGAYWHQYSEPALWSHYGKDGKNAISAGVLDFDNNTMTVPVNETNNKNYAFTDIAYAYVFYDEGELAITGLTFDGLYQGDEIITSHNVTVNISNDYKKVTVAIPTNELDFAQSKNYTLRFTGQANGVNRTGVIKLVGVKSGKDGEAYKLLLNTVVVKKQVGTLTGAFIPSTITPKLVITGGDKKGVHTPTQIESDSVLRLKFEIKYSHDGSDLQPLRDDSIPVTNDIQDFIIVVLLYNGDIIDQELIFIINDGHDGIPATVYNILPKFSNVKYDGTNTSGQFGFKVSRQIGSNPVEYLQQEGEEWGSVNITLEKSGDSKQLTSQLTNDTFSCNISESGDYDFIKISLFITDTLMNVVVIPVIKDNSGDGPQSLEYSVLKNKPLSDSNSTVEELFYCGRNVAEGGIRYQHFVKWNGTVDGKSPNDQWGTYLCIEDGLVAPKDIPTDTTHFIKLDYDFSVVADYLIAKEGFIESLSVNQLVVLNNDGSEVVAGMTSGNKLPDAAGERKNNNDIRIWAGSVPSTGDISSAAFTVSSSGHLKAEDAEIKGTVDATSFKSTSFKVYDRSTSDENNLRMEMTTWGTVENHIDQTKIDSNTLSKLTSSTPVIVVTDERGNQYILNMLALGGDSVDINVTFYNLTKSGGYVSETPYVYVLHNGEYYNQGHLVRDFTGYEEVSNLAGLIPFTLDDTYGNRLLMVRANVKYYRKVKIVLGILSHPDSDIYTIGDIFNRTTFDGSYRKDYIVKELMSPITDFGNSTWWRAPFNQNTNRVIDDYPDYNIEDTEWTTYLGTYNYIGLATSNINSSTIDPSNGLTLINPAEDTYMPGSLYYASVSNN